MSQDVSLHDKFFKVSLKEKSIAIDFFKHHLPDNIQKCIDFSTLKLESSDYVDKKQHHHASDVLYSVSIEEKPGFLYILAEHQSSSDKFMSFRLWQYMCLIWSDFFKKHPSKKSSETTLPYIYPMVFYHGKQKPYKYSLDFLDCFADRTFAKSLYYDSFQLVDVNQISDEELSTHGLAAPFELIQKHILQRDFHKFINKMLKSGDFQFIQVELGGKYLLYTIEYIAKRGDLPDYNEFFDRLAAQLPESGDKVMTIAERLRQEGEQKGLEQGLEEGAHRGRLELARILVKNGHDIVALSNITGIPVPELEIS